MSADPELPLSETVSDENVISLAADVPVDGGLSRDPPVGGSPAPSSLSAIDPLQSEAAIRLDLAAVEAEEELEEEVAEEEADVAYKETVSSGKTVTEDMLLAEARRRVYAKLDTYGPKDLLLVYVRGLSLEEQRLKMALRRKDKDTTLTDLRKKAADAIRGAGGRVDDDDDTD